MFSASTQYYDLIYSSFKDYKSESDAIAELICRENPAATHVLDVACGTGQHASFLARYHGYTVDCVDLDSSFVDIALSKPGVRAAYQGDMTSFELPERYDVILCLFSSIGYVRTLDGVVETFSRFRQHLRGGGVCFVEPWFEPGVIDPGRISIDTADGDNVRLCRMAQVTLDVRLSTIHFEYLIGQPNGIDHVCEKHELGLFTRREMMRSFSAARFAAEHDSVGLSGRGFYVARPE